jgi:hypothetical protein
LLFLASCSYCKFERALHSAYSPVFFSTSYGIFIKARKSSATPLAKWSGRDASVMGQALRRLPLPKQAGFVEKRVYE